MPRNVSLLLLDRTGHLLGALEPIELPFPHWQEASDVVQAVRQRDGLDVVVLRLLFAENPRPPGGSVTYLAELGGLSEAPPERLPELRSVPQAVSELARRPHPLRAPWAEPGGPRASLAWVRAELDRLGLGELRSAEQQRSWNLSTIWRVCAGSGQVFWLKQLPRFFSHETAILRWLNARLPGLAPDLLAAGTMGRQLLVDAPGEDRYGAGVGERAWFAELLHGVQREAVGAVAELARLGVPDRRGLGLARFIRQWLSGSGVDPTPAAGLLSSLEDRLSALAACGLPDTLVHGDFHPGNVRSDGVRATLLDWGDAFLGHPGFDLLRLTGDVPNEDAQGLAAAWCQRWRALCPESKPARALELLRPLAPLLGAAIYARFVGHIEPSEHPYHRDDVPALLEVAGSLAEPTAHLWPGG